MRWPFVSRRERLRREAADWIVRLNGPHGEQDRADFRRWYESHPDHAQAYDRLSSLFQTAGTLSRAEGNSTVERGLSSRSRPLRYAFAVAVAFAALLAVALLSARTTVPVAEPQQQFATLATDGGESRRVVLVDGSEVLLSLDSRLVVAIGATERRLRLLKGEARFVVARELRPFIVEANGAEVVARGTVFIVHVGDGRTTVSLVEGRVDVSYPQPTGPGGRRIARLAPGERLVVEATETRAASPSAAAPSVNEARPSFPRSHNIKFLRSLAEDNEPRLIDAWPRATKLDRRRFELLKRAYVEARYSANYAIGREDLDALAGGVRRLRDLVEAVSLERLAELRAAATAPRST